MKLPDVNILVYAHREESPEHPRYAAWLRALATGPEPFALSELSCSAFVRIVTQARLWRSPTPIEMALEFISRLRARPGCRPLLPGPDNWRIFSELCAEVRSPGKVVADAYHAALAIEHGCELVTADGDFARFKNLRWSHPLRA